MNGSSSLQLLRRLSKKHVQNGAMLISTSSCVPISSLRQQHHKWNFDPYSHNDELIQQQQQHEQQQQLYIQKNVNRYFGTRGSSGRGWYVNYRSDDETKGGRHLRGEYYDRESIEERQQWNQSILDLGSTRVFLDIVLEPIKTKKVSTSATETAAEPIEEVTVEANNVDDDNVAQKSAKRNSKNKIDVTDLKGKKFRLLVDLATTIMPESTTNFINLLNDEYIGTKFYRFEKNVGIFGGDIIHNTGRSGRAAVPKSNDIKNPSMLLDIVDDPLALWHIPGTVSMLVPKVKSIDSRFIICTQHAEHIDGIHRAIGQLTPESTVLVNDWHTTLITRHGMPVSFDLVIADCGIVQKQTDNVLPDESAAA
jgi:cyclophilin family peptidyl-prolyl cis-trans isomerase